MNNEFSRRDKKNAYKAFLSILRTATCTHQGQIAQHFLLGNEYHKKLRLAVESQDIDKIRKSQADFERLHFDSLKQAWIDSVKYLETYYKLTRKSGVNPRMCIKGTVRNPDSSHVTDQLIVDILREDCTRSLARNPVSKNTGFKQVQDTGRFYRENNIPEAVKLRSYVNPRLNGKLAADYKAPSRFSSQYWKKNDKEWTKCWDVADNAEVNSAHCYKSTLIVPMTLANNPLTEAFSAETLVGLISKEDRSIYGFLCFDHPEKDFFNESDINIGYIFADLLSLYLITRDALVSHSTVCEKARQILKGGNHGK